MIKEIVPGMRLRHFKGFISVVVTVAMHTETGEDLVIYHHEGEDRLFARPIDMFFSKVDKKKYPDATQEYRFEIIE